MKQTLTFILALLVLMGIHAEDYQLRVGQFDRLVVNDSINVIYRSLPDSTGIVAFRADKSFADAIIYNINDGQLKVNVSTEFVGRQGLPTVYIYSDFLTSVSNSGSGKVKIENPAPNPKFKANLMGNGAIEVSGLHSTDVQGKITTGNGLITLSGRCQTLNLQLIGTGTIQADCLEADVVKIKSMGGGSIGCWPVSSLNANCLGTTKIYYKGDPVIKKKGGGKLLELE